METKLSWKFLLIAIMTNVIMLVLFISLASLIGSKAASPQSIVFICALGSTMCAGFVTGLVCAKGTSTMPLTYAMICGLVVTSFICITSASDSTGASILPLSIPTVSFLSPIISAYLFRTKSGTKRKLRNLGIKV